MRVDFRMVSVFCSPGATVDTIMRQSFGCFWMSFPQFFHVKEGHRILRSIPRERKQAKVCTVGIHFRAERVINEAGFSP